MTRSAKIHFPPSKIRVTQNMKLQVPFRQVALSLGLLCLGCLPFDAFAESGDPVAVRRVKDGYSIETMWNLTVQIASGSGFESSDTQGVDLIRHPSSGDSHAGRIRESVAPDHELDRMLDRIANIDSISWTKTSKAQQHTANAIRVRTLGPLIVIDVDGIRISYIDHETKELNAAQRDLVRNTNVLIVGNGNGISTAADLLDASVVVVGNNDEATKNTIVACANGEQEKSKTTVALSDHPTSLSQEVLDLIAAKEAACRASQSVFRKLSTKQMNFRPSNGTHTPRWNTEHMMGRELRFFSQIFHGQDQNIPVIDLNPKQMPPQYVAAHADWTGAEEARQMERVSAFTRRFAYLLKDLPLDEKPPGSNWTLRGLLVQMDRHYSEHTANVQKKFELDEWPKE
ncbi:MAG: DinB family protein [Rubripirellula sp.]